MYKQCLCIILNSTTQHQVMYVLFLFSNDTKSQASLCNITNYNATRPSSTSHCQWNPNFILTYQLGLEHHHLVSLKQLVLKWNTPGYTGGKDSEITNLQLRSPPITRGTYPTNIPTVYSINHSLMLLNMSGCWKFDFKLIRQKKE